MLRLFLSFIALSHNLVLFWDHPTMLLRKSPSSFPTNLEVQGRPITNQELENLPKGLISLVDMYSP